jgi:hypothetical protein
MTYLHLITSRQVKGSAIVGGTVVVENDACICNETELAGDIEVIGNKYETVDYERHTILTIRTYNKHSGNNKKDEQ